MARYVELLWNPDREFGLTRRDRAPGRYLAFVPDELGDGLPELGAEARQAAEDALGVLARADERIGSRGRTAPTVGRLAADGSPATGKAT